MNFLFWCIVGYLAGCVNGAQLIGKKKGINIKENGVKNAGASNTTLLLGWKYGVYVAVIDIAKAVIPLVFIHLYGGEQTTLLLYSTGFFVIVGHIYPITMKFQGGKGTASLVGVLFAIDWKMGLIGVVVFILITFLTDYIVIGTLALYLVFVTMTILASHGAIAIIISLLLTALSSYKHLENYQRISKKTETKISSLFKKK